MTKYAIAKRDYDVLVKALKSPLTTGSERAEARINFIASAQEMFPSLSRAQAQFAVKDLINYNATRYAKRGKK